MSLILTDESEIREKAAGNAKRGEHEESAQISRYLAVLEENRGASRFVLDDAALALDMAGFVKNRLRKGRAAQANPLARLALALVQKSPITPEQ